MQRHEPVLKEEVIKLLNLKPGKKVVDGTLGDAGHAEYILKAISPNGQLLGIDTDPEAILRANKFLKKYKGRFVIVQDNFVNLDQILEKKSFGHVHAILLDLGWSTPQFEERGRGFSFQKDEPLDMRLGGEEQVLEGTKTATEILNNYNVDELEKIFRDYGEEKFSKDIAKTIVDYRKKEKILKTGQLVDIVSEVYKKKHVREKINPATKVFQALRIEVNKELDVLKVVLPKAIDALVSGGKLAVISFHSLEDRIVKHFLKLNRDKLKIITKKPVTATKEELEKNRKARSAKLRVAEKI
jgi:16S rRNA (cytosine1402-N4)-methyltransferase